jgi:hypothetical protein
MSSSNSTDNHFLRDHKDLLTCPQYQTKASSILVESGRSGGKVGE